MSALPPKADKQEKVRFVPFVPKADVSRCSNVKPKLLDPFVGASEEHGGMSMPSVLAVCRLMTSSNLGHGARGATDRGLDGVGSEPSVGQPGSLQRARPALEVALTSERQQLRQVRQA